MVEQKRVQFSLANVFLMTAVAALATAGVTYGLRHGNPWVVVLMLILGIPTAVGGLFGGASGMRRGLAVGGSVALAIVICLAAVEGFLGTGR